MNHLFALNTHLVKITNILYQDILLLRFEFDSSIRFCLI